MMQFEISQWSADDLCCSPQAVIEVIDRMNSVQRRTGNKPIVVHGR